ncbi:hypothetical protein WJX84_003056 [Apatococcus fuscideae]|uniref:Uncharacterized protein n=1 Tax=Apatococcus fuscideae TaxID=2026836 RepID=A0AAW1SZ27_9CHLO
MCRPPASGIWLLTNLLLHILGLSCTTASFGPQPETTVLTPGSIPIDTDGNQVHAHGGALIEMDGIFFWYGTSQKQPPGWLSTDINLYSSEDLAEWRNEGSIFNWQSIVGMPTGPPYRIERPKIIWCEEFHYWVLWFHLDLPSFGYPAVGVAKAETLQGPFDFVQVFKPDGRSSFDMTLFQDDDDTAYLVRSVENSFLGITKLAPNYLGLEGGICAQTPFQAEAPAVFKHGPSSYWILSSHLTGWAPNPPLLWHANSSEGLCGTSWYLMPQPATGPGSETTWDSQSTAVFPYQTEDGRELLMYLGDRWNAAGPGGVAQAGYVWLPLIPTAAPSQVILADS